MSSLAAGCRPLVYSITVLPRCVITISIVKNNNFFADPNSSIAI